MRVLGGWKVLVILVVFGMVDRVRATDLVIRVPKIFSDQQDGFYRLDYSPPVGFPAANTTFKPLDLRDAFRFSEALPGTKYDFYLYYSNSSFTDRLTWTASIETSPDPGDPLTMLTVDVVDGTHVRLGWRPPSLGKHSRFNLKLVPLSEPSKPVQSFSVKETIFGSRNISTFTLQDLSPGATYEIHVYSVLEEKESETYVSTKFTTKPNTPGRLSNWFHNETVLMVIWQPPRPTGFYTNYKVFIHPEEALISDIVVAKEGEPPAPPAQAAFRALFPGRAYNISVSTVSKGQISDPSRVQYRTVPLRPHNVTFDPLSVGSDSFTVRWSAPEGPSEFDRYQVAIGTSRKTPQIVERGKELVASFTENLRPGRTYQVIVTTVTVSGVASWPARGNVTTRPLPVRELRQEVDSETSAVKLTWEPNPDSLQDSFKVRVVWLHKTGSRMIGEKGYFDSQPKISKKNKKNRTHRNKKNPKEKNKTEHKSTKKYGMVWSLVRPYRTLWDTLTLGNYHTLSELLLHSQTLLDTLLAQSIQECP